MNGSGTIQFRGVDMIIEYYHEPFEYATRDEPAQGDFYIESVKIGGVEVFNLLDDLYCGSGFTQKRERAYNPIISELESQYLKENFNI